MRHATLPTRPLDRGFSFIELLAYMAIAALLILAAIPQFSAYRERALVSNLQNDVRNASLSAEASLIAKRGDASGATIKLASTAADTAPTPGSFAAIAAAVATTKMSDPQSVLKTVDLGAGEYEIRGTNPKTSRMAVFASKADVPRGFAQGLSLVDASRNDDGAAPGTTPGGTTPGGTTPTVPTNWCETSAPAPTVRAAGIYDGNVIKYRDSFVVDIYQRNGTPTIASGGVKDATDVRVWAGNTAMCRDTSVRVFDNGGAGNRHGITVRSGEMGEYVFSSAFTMSKDPITVQFTVNGATHVVLVQESTSIPWTVTDDVEAF